MAECIALSCPRLQNTDPDNRDMAITVPSALITRDAMGNTFCNHCQHARAIMDYGHANNWPEVRAGRYLIPVGHAEWHLSVTCGDRDLIETFYAELFGNEEVA